MALAGLAHESVAVLAGHPSPLLQNDSEHSKLHASLHPGERDAFQRLGRLAQLYTRLDAFVHTASSTRTPALATLCRLLNVRVADAYMADVLRLEELVLSTHMEVLKTVEMHGLESSSSSAVPVAYLLAEMGKWEGALAGVSSLIDGIESGPEVALGTADTRPRRVMFDEASADAGNDFPARGVWTCARLITLVERHAFSGVPLLKDVFEQALLALSRQFQAQLSAFIIFGHVTPLDPVMQHDTTSAHDVKYVVPEECLPAVHGLAYETERQPVLASMRSLALALGILHSIPASDIEVVALDKASLDATMRKSVEQEFSGCDGPIDETFPRRLATVATVLSSHVLAQHLPRALLRSTFQLLSAIYLLRSSDFASRFVRELDALRSAISTGVTTRPRPIRDSELNETLRKAMPELEDGEDGFDKSAWSLVLVARAKAAAQADDSYAASMMGDMTADASTAFVAEASSDFSTHILGPPLKLEFAPDRSLALLLTRDVLDTYNRFWAFLLALRLIRAKVTTTWASLSQHQRDRHTEGASSGNAKRLVRSTWATTRQMIWCLDAIEEYAHMNVLQEAQTFLDSHLDAADSEDVRSGTSARPSCGGRASMGPGARAPLDFATLSALHSLYLATVSAGLFLNSDAVQVKIAELLEICALLGARIQRWGGDVLPDPVLEELDDYSLDQLVSERLDVIDDFAQTFNTILFDFFELLSSPPSRGARGGGDASSVSLASGSFAGSSTFIGSSSLSAEGGASGGGGGLRLPPGMRRAKLRQDPALEAAYNDASTIARAFSSKLLLRLDFARWFTAGKVDAAERAATREANVLAGLQE